MTELKTCEWERLPLHPDLCEDLGYELLDLKTFETDANQIMFIPGDEDMLQEEAFIIARKEDVHSL